MATTEQRQRHTARAVIADAVEGMAFIFDIAGTMHPGNDQDPDPWIAARDDISDAWQEVGELLGWAVNAHSDPHKSIGPTPA